jgi:hypothetical protein
LRAMGGRARLQELLEKIRAEDGIPDLSYQTVYIAIQLETSGSINLESANAS